MKLNEDFRYRAISRVKADDEVICAYAITTSYIPYFFLAPKGKEISMVDISGCLEETLHRLLENNCKAICAVMGARHGGFPSEEEDVIYIDLDYWIDGLITDVFVPDDEEEM